MNKTVGIILSVLWAVIGLVSVAFALLSVMMFDAPGSESSPLTVKLFWATAALPVFWFLGAILPWVFKSKAFGKWLYLLPLLDIAFIAILVGAIAQYCNGNFSCK